MGKQIMRRICTSGRNEAAAQQVKNRRKASILHQVETGRERPDLFVKFVNFK
jgi:hypothetical protein